MQQDDTRGDVRPNGQEPPKQNHSESLIPYTDHPLKPHIAPERDVPQPDAEERVRMAKLKAMIDQRAKEREKREKGWRSNRGGWGIE